MKKINLLIDGKEVSVLPGTSILDAAASVGTHIPTLCYLKELGAVSACRICVVEVEGHSELLPACSTCAEDGMVIHTDSRPVRDSRRTTLELILSDHPFVCPTCTRNRTCELQKLADELDISMYYDFYGNPVAPLRGTQSQATEDRSGFSIVRDSQKCIRCFRCVEACDKIQSIRAIKIKESGFETGIVPVMGQSLADTDCVNCGQCVRVCPTGALQVHNDTVRLQEYLQDERKTVVAQIAPSVRVAIGEAFGAEAGSIQTGQITAALRQLGFGKVFDTNFGADFTVMEESTELLEYLKGKKAFPLFTSCCPAWVKFMEEMYPEYTGHLSTCQSPQQMFGAILKTWYAERNHLDANNLVCVSIMPCTAKKAELQRDELKVNGLNEVDLSITVVELISMLKNAGIDLSRLQEEPFDDLLGESSGASAIFGTSGGVMEAALRTVADFLGDAKKTVDFEEVRGFEGVRAAEVSIAGRKLKLAMVSGLGNARKLMDAVKSGKADYHFVEVMACPGGCAGGGGMPVPFDLDCREQRASAMYRIDRNKALRKSNENPVLRQIYAELLDAPGSRKALELLHTGYKEVLR